MLFLSVLSIKYFFSVSTYQNNLQVTGQSIDGQKPSSLLFNFALSPFARKRTDMKI